MLHQAIERVQEIVLDAREKMMKSLEKDTDFYLMVTFLRVLHKISELTDLLALLEDYRISYEGKTAISLDRLIEFIGNMEKEMEVDYLQEFPIIIDSLLSDLRMRSDRIQCYDAKFLEDNWVWVEKLKNSLRIDEIGYRTDYPPDIPEFEVFGLIDSQGKPFYGQGGEFEQLVGQEKVCVANNRLLRSFKNIVKKMDELAEQEGARLSDQNHLNWNCEIVKQALYGKLPNGKELPDRTGEQPAQKEVG